MTDRLQDLARGYRPKRMDGSRRQRPRNMYSFREVAAVLGFGMDFTGTMRVLKASIPYQKLRHEDVEPDRTRVWRSQPTRIYVKKADLDAYVEAHKLEIAERSLRKGTLT